MEAKCKTCSLFWELEKNGSHMALRVKIYGYKKETNKKKNTSLIETSHEGEALFQAEKSSLWVGRKER